MRPGVPHGSAARSLREIYTRRWDVPCYVAATAALLLVSLNLPVLYVEKLVFWDDEYSIMDGVVNLFIAAVLASMALTKYMIHLARAARRSG